MSLVRDIDSPAAKPAFSTSFQGSTNTMSIKLFSISLGAAILIGIISGWALGHGKAASNATASQNTSGSAASGSVAKTAGVEDLKTFKDSAEGQLKEGGIDGEGSFHLVRPGGDSQNVYLTSSTVDLSPYVGKKVRVHGQTMAGQKAGWLMDVGFLELLQ